MGILSTALEGLSEVERQNLRHEWQSGHESQTMDSLLGWERRMTFC